MKVIRWTNLDSHNYDCHISHYTPLTKRKKMPNRHNIKTQTLSQNEPDLSTIKMKSRAQLSEIYGPIMEMNVHEDTRQRLRAIAEVLEGESYAEKKRGLGSIYRKAVNDLINIFYIDNLFEAKTKSAKTLYNLYQENYKLRVIDAIKKKDRIKTLSSEYPSPTQLEKGSLTLSESKWKSTEIDKLDDHRWVINTLESLNKN
ncbi:hypothetical protein ACN5PQ_003717 [Cronobacter turicensis]